MAMLDISLPELYKADLSDAKQVRRLKDYMYMLTEQLRYVLSNLESENLGDTLQQSITVALDTGVQAKTAVEECRVSIKKNADSLQTKVSQEAHDELSGRVLCTESTLTQQADLIATKVSRTDHDTLAGRVTAAESTLTQQADQIAAKVSTADFQSALTLRDNKIALVVEPVPNGAGSRVKAASIVSAINNAESSVSIAADHIALEGLVTANEKFKIDENGSMEAVDGKFSGTIAAQSGSIGDFTVDESGGLFGKSLKVGGMTLYDTTIAGVTSIPGVTDMPALSVRAENLDYASYSRGTPAFLAIANGELVAVELDIVYQGGTETASDNGSSTIYALGPAGGGSNGGGTGGSVNKPAIQLWESGVNGRSQPNLNASVVCTLGAGSLYGYLSGNAYTANILTGADGKRWACCNTKFTLNPATGKYGGTSVTPFYVREVNERDKTLWTETTVPI